MKPHRYDVSWVTREALALTIASLLDRYVDVHVSVAWATRNDVFEALRKTSKLKTIVVGTHFYQTDPWVIEQLQDHPGARIAGADKALFHPKLYFFETCGSWACLIGSPNLTKAAISSNVESAVLVVGGDPSPLAADIREAISSHATQAVAARDFDLTNYTLKYEAARRAWKALNQRPPPIHPQAGARNPRVAQMPWENFARRVRAEPRFPPHRLRVLRFARERLSAKPFHQLALKERKAIAGTLRDDADVSGEATLWGLFGSMIGAGVFKSLVNRTPEGLSKALDAIPATGEVEQDHYDEFVRLIGDAYRGGGRGAGIAPPTRLLAMKRPDYFLAINGENRKAFSEDFGVPASRITLRTYWDEVVERVRLCKWWQTTIVPTNDLPIWNGRAALLDALYYRPD